MNGRTARLLNRAAQNAGISSKALKREWKRASAKERAKSRRRLICAIALAKLKGARGTPPAVP